jgi:hypothetical protein
MVDITAIGSIVSMMTILRDNVRRLRAVLRDRIIEERGYV